MMKTHYLNPLEAQARTQAARKVLWEFLLKEARAAIHNQIQLACESGLYSTIVDGDTIKDLTNVTDWGRILTLELESAGYKTSCDDPRISISWEPEEVPVQEGKRTGPSEVTHGHIGTRRITISRAEYLKLSMGFREMLNKRLK